MGIDLIRSRALADCLAVVWWPGGAQTGDGLQRQQG